MNIRTLLLLFLAALTVGCIEEITVETDRVSGQLIIDGVITGGPGPHQVRIARASEKTQISTPVKYALVTLKDSDGNSEVLVPSAEEDGIYLHLGSLITAQPGKAYHLEVNLIEGQRYATRPDTMPAVVGQDSAWFSQGTENGLRVVNVFAQSTLPVSERPIYLRWAVEEVYQFSPTDFPDPWNNIPPSCYVFDEADPQRINLYDGSRFRTTLIEEHKVAVRKLDQTFRERHFFNIYQRSMSEAAFRYWEQVDIISNQSGSIFDIPPAPIRGNAYSVDNEDEQVLGFFSVVKEDTTRFSTWPADFNFWVSDPCDYEPFKQLFQYPDECLDCTIIEGSTYAKPDYFF